MKKHNLAQDQPPNVHCGRWRFRLEDTYDVAVEMRACRTIENVRQCLLKTFERYGATNLLAGLIPPPNLSIQAQLSHVLLDAWPKDWSRRYFSLGYLCRDPAIRLVQRRCPHFHWNDIAELCSVCPLGRRIMSEAGEFHLSDGITFSFSTPDNTVFGFSVAAEKLELAARDRYTLQFLAAYGLGCALALSGGHVNRDDIHLSPRQREVLAWASEGLTSDEIADRLNVSVHTAEMHLRAVRARLGVANTVHAVAESLRRGLIS